MAATDVIYFTWWTEVLFYMSYPSTKSFATEAYSAQLIASLFVDNKCVQISEKIPITETCSFFFWYAISHFINIPYNHFLGIVLVISDEYVSRRCRVLLSASTLPANIWTTNRWNRRDGLVRESAVVLWVKNPLPNVNICLTCVTK